MAKVMIGVDYGSYSFNAASSQVTINLPNGSPKLESVLLITNVTDNIIIYNFADATLGGTLSGNVLTLTYSTVAMSDSDKLQIWYYAEETPNVIATQDILNISQALPDSQGRLRIILDGTNNLSTVTTVSTVSTITNINNYSAITHIPYTMQIPAEIQLQKIIVT